MALKVDVEDDEEYVEEDVNDKLIEYIALLAKIFGQVMIRFDRRSKNNVITNVKGNLPLNTKGFNPYCNR